MNRRAYFARRAAFFGLGLLLFLLLLAASNHYAPENQAPTSPTEHGPCFDDRYGRDLPPIYGTDC